MFGQEVTHRHVIKNIFLFLPTNLHHLNTPQHECDHLKLPLLGDSALLDNISVKKKEA